MKRPFLFVNLAIDAGYAGVNHGIAYLVPVVKKHGYQVSCLDVRETLTLEEFGERVSAAAPQVVAFSSTSHQLRFLDAYSKALASEADVLQIAGGVASTLDPEWILRQTAVQGVCIGEGERPVDELLTRLDEGRDITETEGFWWRAAEGGVRVASGKWQVAKEEAEVRGQRAEVRGQRAEGGEVSGSPEIIKNPVPGFVEDLSTFPFPDYSVFERSVVVNETGQMHIMLSRGCPYNCYYCCNRSLSCVYPSGHGYFRMPSVDYGIRLLEDLVRQYPEARRLEFEDDLLIADKPWFLQFAEQYRQRIGLPYRACVRVEAVNEEIVNALKESGCARVLLGLESGNEEFRKEYLNRRYSNRQLVEKCRILRKAGLDLFTFNIVGFPFETAKEMRDTLRLNRKARPNGGVCTFFFPYKGTRLYEICEENGLLRPEEEMMEITNYNTRPAVLMTPDQEKTCRRFQEKITAYLEKRRMLTTVESLPLPIPRCLKRFFSGYWYSSVLKNQPAVFRLLRSLYRASGLKRLVRRFLRSNGTADGRRWTRMGERERE